MSLAQFHEGPEIHDISPPVPPVRPSFNHLITSDRLRESSWKGPFLMVGNLKRGRKSVFKEVGLDDDEISPVDFDEREFGELTGLCLQSSSPKTKRLSTTGLGMGSASDENEQESPQSPTEEPRKPWLLRFRSIKRPKIRMGAASNAPPPSASSLQRLSMIALLIAVVLPGFSYYNGKTQVSLNGADAGVIDIGVLPLKEDPIMPLLESRENSPTQVCTRWSHQTAQLNGTLYIYGGQATTSSDQKTNTWNNNFLTLDLTKSWDINSPALAGLPQPSGPPAVANGYLWNDYNHLFLYGGEFADNPYVSPAEIATWKYTISSGTWTEYANPQTSAGDKSDGGGTTVQRAAEGAGISVPELGLSWYFGGHLDWATTPGWSTQTDRVYLKSLLEFTHPTYTNDAVISLAGGSGAGEGGVYRNITQGGLQVTEGFYERADGVLVFVPGWGKKGVLIGLAGGTNDTFANDLSTLDVYDIASSVWYHQQTSGTAPGVRVNPCAVVASAPDASSFQIYLYGGQNLQPYKQQVQYSDMYILSIPSFTWIPVPQTSTSASGSIPAPRAGHTCNLHDGQIIVVGGYLGNASTTTGGCDSPGIYIFNATSLAWTQRFTALTQYAPDADAGNSVLADSHGYAVPDAVASVIGGDGQGGATVTTPVTAAPGGPFATGTPPVFTVTKAGGTGVATVTQTQVGPNGAVGTGTGTGAGGAADASAGDARRPQLIAAGVLAGAAGLLAGYLGYCAWIYRRQVRAYKTHLVAANRYGAGMSGSGSSTPVRPPGSMAGGLALLFGGGRGRGGYGRTWRRGHERDDSSGTEDSFTWVPSTEAKRPFADGGEGSWAGFQSGSGSGATPGSGAGGSGSGSGEAMPRGSTSSTEGLLDGQEPSFFHVVMGPRRALRVVNGLEGDGDREGL